MNEVNGKKTVYNKDDDDGLLISSSSIPHHKSNRSGWERKGSVRETELWLNSTQRWYGELCRSNACRSTAWINCTNNAMFQGLHRWKDIHKDWSLLASVNWKWKRQPPGGIGTEWCLCFLYFCFSILPYMNISGKSIAVAVQPNSWEHCSVSFVSDRPQRQPHLHPSPAFSAFSDSLYAP